MSLLFILSREDISDSWEESNHQQTALAPESPPGKATVMYVDDATKIVADNDIINLPTRNQTRVERATEWLLDIGMVVAPHISKFLLTCSREQRIVHCVARTIGVGNQE